MDGEAHHSTKPERPSATTSAAGLSWRGKVANFKMQVSRTALKVGFHRAQQPLLPFALDKIHRLLVGHRLAAMAAMRPRQTCR